MKGIIMEQAENGVYVLTQSGEFRFVSGHTHLSVGEEIHLNASKKPVYRLISVIAACIALFLCIGAAALWQTEAYTVFVDINPSFQICFNVFDRVKAVKPLNADGEEFLRQLKLSGGYQSVLTAVLAAAEEYGRAEGLSGLGAPYIQLTIASAQDENLSLYYVRIDEFLESNDYDDVVLDICTQGQRSEAHDYDISPGKLMMSEQVRKYQPEYNIESAKQMSTVEFNLSIGEAEMAIKAARIAEEKLETALEAALLAETAAKTAQAAAQQAEALASRGRDADRQMIQSLANQAQNAAFSSRDAACDAERAAAEARAQADNAAQASSAAAQAGIEDAENFATQAEQAAKQAAYHASLAGRYAQSAQAAANATANCEEAQPDADPDEAAVLNSNDFTGEDGIESTDDSDGGATDADPGRIGKTDEAPASSNNNDGDSVSGENALESDNLNDSSNTDTDKNAEAGIVSPADENSSGSNVNSNANENSSSNNGSPAGQNSSGSNNNSNANPNSNSNNGSPAGQNSSGSNNNSNANPNSNSNNGSPAGQNSGNGNNNGNGNSNNGSPGGQNSGNNKGSETTEAPGEEETDSGG